MSDQLFKRQAIVIVGEKQAKAEGVGVRTALRVDELRIVFKVKKDGGSKPNTSEVEITGLNEASRAAVQSKGAPLIIQAGFPTTIATLFSGTVRTADPTHTNADWVTKIRSGDGEIPYAFATLSNSYRAGTPVRVVLTELVDSLGIDPGNSRRVFAALSEQFVHGHTAHGASSRQLDEILGGLGFEWSIQDGRFQVLKRGDASLEEVVELAADSGLIGSPEHGSGDGQKPVPKSSIVKLTATIQPRLKPGSRISVKSAGVNGVHRVLTVEHEGDTHGPKWETRVDAVPV